MTLRRPDETTTVTDLTDALDWLGDTPQDLLEALPDAHALPIRHAYNTHRVEADLDLLAPDEDLPEDAFEEFAPMAHIDGSLAVVLDHLLDAGSSEYLRLPPASDESAQTEYRLVRLAPEKGY